MILSSFQSASAYPESLRKISSVEAETGKRLVFLTNNFNPPALTIAQIYKQRLQVELLFKWIKLHLRVKAFYGASENAVKTKIRIRHLVSCAGGIVRKRLALEASLYQILQSLSITRFEKTPILRELHNIDSRSNSYDSSNQLTLFTLYPDSSGAKQSLASHKIIGNLHDARL